MISEYLIKMFGNKEHRSKAEINGNQHQGSSTGSHPQRNSIIAVLANIFGNVSNNYNQKK